DSSSMDTTVVTDIDAMNQTIVNLACSICGENQSLCFRKCNETSAAQSKLQLFCMACKKYIGGNSDKEKNCSTDSVSEKDSVVVREKKELNAEYLKYNKATDLNKIRPCERGSPRKTESTENVSFQTLTFYGSKTKENQKNISSPYPKLKKGENISSAPEREPLKKCRSLKEVQNNAENIASNKNYFSSREKLQTKNKDLSYEVQSVCRKFDKGEKFNGRFNELINIDDEEQIKIQQIAMELMKGSEEENNMNSSTSESDPLKMDDLPSSSIKSDEIYKKGQSVLNHCEIDEIIIPSYENDQFPSDDKFLNTPPHSEEEKIEDPLGVSFLPGMVF
ncbi:unnamed protein product, partial [Meganyctiphanes norvegica]